MQITTSSAGWSHAAHEWSGVHCKQVQTHSIEPCCPMDMDMDMRTAEHEASLHITAVRHHTAPLCCHAVNLIPGTDRAAALLGPLPHARRSLQGSTVMRSVLHGRYDM
jgi:hypothetical protein